MVIDSTLLIDILREKEAARKYILSIEEDLSVSRIVVMEIVAGSKNKREVQKNLQLISDLHLEIVEISERISLRAGELFEQYFHQFGLGITDALIAATALESRQKLATHNIKHFRYIKGLELVKPY